MSLDPWEAKAARIITMLCRESERQANTNPRTGKRYAQHRPYSVPWMAQELVRCLGHCYPDSEERAKALFIQYAVIPDSGKDF